MSPLLEDAMAAARCRPDEEQDAIAAIILAELDDDRRWEEAFGRAPEKLAALAERAAEQVRAGHRRAAGFDEL